MKLLTWNINGIRGNKGLPLKELLDSLDADIICLQETKVTRDQLDEASAVVEGYNSYFSFSKVRAGYSGVATFVRDEATPWKAEDGLSDLAKEQNEDHCIGYYGNSADFMDDELIALDREGRCVMTQHKIRDLNRIERDLVVINVYCPRADIENEERKAYKMRFYQLLQLRAEEILKSGRSVVVLGDINTSHQKIDHCDPAGDEEFYANPGRKWLDKFLCDPVLDDVSTELVYDVNICHDHQFIDTFRLFHPDQLEAFTNWCTVTSARETNYGCRLDYIFADKILAKSFFSDCYIMPEVQGSDHCPVKAVLSCSPIPANKCPPLCTKYMPQFSGKQQKLSMFLVKTAKRQLPSADSENSSRSSQMSNYTDCETENLASSQESLKQLAESNLNPNTNISQLEGESDVNNSHSHLLETSLSQTSSKVLLRNGSSFDASLPVAQNSFNTSQTLKRTASDSKNCSGAKKLKPEPKVTSKQCNLLSFFGKSVSQASLLKCDAADEQHSSSDFVSPISDCDVSGSIDTVIPNDQGLNVQQVKNGANLRSVQSSVEASDKNAGLGLNDEEAGHSTNASAWKSLLKGPPETPLCKGHKEPCVLRTVKKAGPNRGRQFWTCNRPEGHKTNPDARCDYFVWVSNKR